MASTIDLTRNPFHILGVSVYADLEQIVDAREAALLANRADECVLDQAQFAVRNPRTRIEAELSWLSATPPAEAKRMGIIRVG